MKKSLRFATLNLFFSSFVIFIVMVFFLIPSISIAQGPYIEKTPMPTKRLTFGTAVVNGKIYAIGGLSTETEPLSVMEVYDPVTNSWDTTLKPMPTARGSFGCTVVDGKIYAIGGGVVGEYHLSLVERYDPVTNTWDTTASMLTSRYAVAAGTVNGKIYVIGGAIGNGIFPGIKTVEEYDPVNNQWNPKKDKPTPGWGLRAAVVDEKIYVTGGNIQWPNITDVLEVYDPYNDSWDTLRTPLPGPRYSHSTPVYNDKIFCFGGWLASGTGPIYDDVFRYDPIIDKWINKTPMPYPVAEFATEEFDGKIYIMGGTTTLHPFTKTDIVYEYDPAADPILVPEHYPTIQAGIDAASDGDIVLVRDSTYYENINFKGKAIKVASHFLIDGDTSHISNTIIDGSQPSHPDSGSVVTFSSGEDTTSVLCGFTITGGTGSMYDAIYRVGGGIYCANSGARISNNKIVSNTINHDECNGGGIGFWPRTNAEARYVIIEDNIIESNTIFSSNAASYIQGAGIHIVEGRITANTIRFNSVTGQPAFAGGGGIAAGCEDTATRTMVIITGNTITHNQATTPGTYGGYGGGVDVVFCNVQILNNEITHNEVSGNTNFGGGIRLWRSKESSIIRDNIISFNSARTMGIGAGIWLNQTQEVQIIDNEFKNNNSTGWGGAISVYNSTESLIRGNEFIGNAADSSGGGLDIEFSNSTVIDKNLFKQNNARWGGGLFKGNGNLILTNNNFIENEGHFGGGILCLDYPPGIYTTQIINSTLTENIADTAGSIACIYSEMKLMNTISWGNTAPNGPEIEMWGGSLSVAYSDIQFGQDSIAIDSAATINWLDGNIDADPQFVPGDPLYHLSSTSPCINMGIDSLLMGGIMCCCPRDDYEGNERPYMGIQPDIGADETQVAPVGIEPHPFAGILKSYVLFQNYPNPFNPATSIEFSIPKFGFVTLKVYNILGEEVATLVSMDHTAGKYKYNWDASSMASGVYLYRIQAGDYVEVKKMVLLR